ncbi:MAG: superoxide dismutase [Verrucomicrobiota bacterium]
MQYSLDPLAYAFDALEPHIDAQTMEIHHDRHHQTYVDKLNGAIADLDIADGTPVDQLLTDLKDLIPEAKQGAVINHGGGHSNHSKFWDWIAPGGATEPTGDVAGLIESTFGGLDGLKEKFNAAAATQFGSGWAWVVKSGDSLEVTSTPNQNSPLLEGKTPILGIDVWEHAYYLKYQNKRPAYIDAFWNVVNWDAVEASFQA